MALAGRAPARRSSSWTCSFRASTASQALALLREAPTTAAIPVIAVTAFAMKDDRERFLHAGFDGYLEKPIGIRALLERVQRALADRRRGGPA